MHHQGMHGGGPPGGMHGGPPGGMHGGPPGGMHGGPPGGMRPDGSASSRGVSSDQPQSSPPTAVLHVRQLPYGASPHDVAEFLSQFGPVDFASLLPNKGQALVEFRDVAAAGRVVETGQRQPLTLGGRTLYVNFSRSKQINRAVATRMTGADLPPGAATAYDASGGRAPIAPRPDVMDDRPLPARHTFTSGVLCLHVNKATAPIDVDTVLRVCASAAPELRVLRVVIFYKHGVQALVELESPDASFSLAERVHNQFIYQDCCKIVAAPSRTSTGLNVTAQNDLTRDLTRSDLPSAPPSNPRSLTPAQMAEKERAIESGDTAAAAPAGPPPGYAPPGMGGPPAHHGGPPPHGYAPHGGPPPGMGGPPHHGGGGGGGPPPGGFGRPGPGGPPPAARPPHTGVSAQASYMPGSGGRGAVVRVTGLDPARATARRVFNFVCSYGNVRRIGCFPPGAVSDDGGASSALVEFEDATQAGGAASFLNGQTIFGRSVSLVVSDRDTIDGSPLSGEAPDPLGEPHVRDWVGSPHNRFRRPEQFRNVFRPSPTLHISNIPPGFTEARLQEFIMSSGGARPDRVAWMDPPGGRFSVGAPRRVALVQFSSSSEALESMMMANNAFTDGHTIKLAPTNKTPR